MGDGYVLEQRSQKWRSIAFVGTLFLSLFFWINPIVAAPITCTGSTTGKTGTCSGVASCDGSQEIPVSITDNRGTHSPCSDGQICCIPSDTTKPSKEPPVVLPPSGLPPTTPPTTPLAGTPPVTVEDCATGYTKVSGVCFPENTGLSDKSVLDIIAALVGWLFALFGFIAIIGFVISGLQYLFSAGDEGRAETAKRNMKYCIIGIIVALSGYIMVKAVDTLLNANPLI